MKPEPTLPNLVHYWGMKKPYRVAIADGSRRISYGELKEEIDQLTRGLARMDIRKGEKILTILPNWYEFVVLFFSLARLGAVIIPCNSKIDEKELIVRMKSTQPKMVFTDTAHLSSLQPFKEFCPVITVRSTEEDYLSYSDFLETGKITRKYHEQPHNEKDLFAILFISDSIHCSKGVKQSYLGLLQSVKNIGFTLKCTRQDSFLVPLPYAQMFGMIAGMLLPLYFGSKIILMENDCPKQVLARIGKEKATVLCGAPNMFTDLLLEYSEGNQRKIDSLRTGIIAGTHCWASVIRQIYEDLKCEIMVAYGSTETAAVSMTTFKDPYEKRWETVGQPFKDIEVKVVNSSGEPVPSGEVGELLCNGVGVMQGYYHQPEETRKVLAENGWFFTGDLATIDTQGYLNIVTRKKDVIQRQGERIFPAEVEAVYYQHPGVVEVCAVGIPDRRLGEILYACIRLRNTYIETEKTLREFANGNTAEQLIPDHIVILDELPKRENRKYDRQALRRICKNRSLSYELVN